MWNGGGGRGVLCVIPTLPHALQMLRHTDRDGMSVAYHACARDSPEVLALLLNGAEVGFCLPRPVFVVFAAPSVFTCVG